MEETLQIITKSLKENYNINDITELKSPKIIYNLFHNNDENFNILELSNIDLSYIGIYYEIKKQYNKSLKYYNILNENEYIHSYIYLGSVYKRLKNYEKAKKYYLNAIEYDNMHHAMCSLGILYEKLEDYDNAKKYYLMAIEYGNITSMNNLGLIYHKLEQYEKAKKYYLNAIENNRASSMYNLGSLYHRLQEYKNAEKYYLLAIEYDNIIHAIINLIFLYEKQNNYENMFKYYFMIINSNYNNDYLKNKIIKISRNILESKNNSNDNLINYIFDFLEYTDINNYNIPLYFRLLKEKINLMKLHFEYSINGKGYQEARNNFIATCRNF